MRQAICNHYYKNRSISPDEIFITDGINSAVTQILDIFDKDATIAIPDPAYPVYLDNAIMKGFGSNIIKMPLKQEHGFNPVPPKKRADIVYLCSPVNPTGTAMSRDKLAVWVRWANENKAILLFDAAYNAFIDDDSVPNSIFEIPGAEFCAIECMSFSKSAGFTGLRLGSVAISKQAKLSLGLSAHQLFKQYLETVSNGVSYPVQKAGLMALSPEAQSQIQQDILSYKSSAKALKRALQDSGWTVFGGKHCPYLWVKIEDSISSQNFCNNLLDNGVVAIAGSGFGQYGEGYFRLSCFINNNTLEKAIAFFKKGKVYEHNSERLLTL